MGGRACYGHWQDMRAYFEPAVWKRARQFRLWQRCLGWIAALCLLPGLLALLDGLAAEMGKSPQSLDLLPNEIITLSGPAPLKNPVRGDVTAVFTPRDAPLGFRLEGFFAGYWFGIGMWRGTVQAKKDAAPGVYRLRVSFRGGGGAANYDLHVFADKKSMHAASASLLTRFGGVNPFVFGAVCAVFGLLAGIGTYIFGRKYQANLGRLGLSEIYRAARGKDGQRRLWCVCGRDAPEPGNARMVLAPDGTLAGEARLESLGNGKAQFVLLDDTDIAAGALICLVPPGNFRKHRRSRPR